MMFLIAVDILAVFTICALIEKSKDFKEEAMKKVDDVCNWWLNRRDANKEDDEE